jgi:hypothetical protein
MGFAEYFCRPDHFCFLAKYGHILGKTMGKTLCSGPRLRPGQASPWGHRPSSSAPCAVPMRLSRADQHIKDEPCAKRRALLGVYCSRFSSVSRGVRCAGSIFTTSSLVRLYMPHISVLSHISETSIRACVIRVMLVVPRHISGSSWSSQMPKHFGFEALEAVSTAVDLYLLVGTYSST